MDKIQIDELKECVDIPESIRKEEYDMNVSANPQYTHGGLRYSLVLQGVCTQCAHCGQPLTDSESVERGIGPICSKKGYLEEVEPVDSTEAMVALSEFPDLVDYLVTKFKDKGNRILVNNLVKLASLNRRSPVHRAITDAVDALGYKRLASALRESISSVEIFESASPDHFAVWVKKVDFSPIFTFEVKKLAGVSFVKFPKRAWIVPRTHRMDLARLIVRFYSGMYIKTATGAHKIGPSWFRG